MSYFEKKIAALEKYELTNGEAKPNEFAGATLEFKQQLTWAIDVIERKDKEHALAMREAKNKAHELHSQVAALAQMIDKLSAEMKSKPTRQTKRRPSITPTVSSDEESKSESEDETPTPQPVKKRLKKKTRKRKAKSKMKKVI